MEPHPGPSTGLAHRLILSSEQAEELVVNSGRQGVFAFIQDNNVGPRPIRWFLLRGAPKMWQSEEIEDFLNKQE